MTSVKRLTVSALLAPALLTMLAAGPARAADPQPVTPFVPGINEDPVLTENWQRWQGKDIDEYAITVRRSCYCVPTAAVRTVVRDDAVHRVTQDGRRLRASRGWSMDELYVMLREVGVEADSVEVDWTPRGVPASISVDLDTSVADDETYYTVSVSRLG